MVYVVGCVLVRPVIFAVAEFEDRKSTRLNSSHGYISYAVFCLKKKTIMPTNPRITIIDRRYGIRYRKRFKAKHNAKTFTVSITRTNTTNTNSLISACDTDTHLI